MRCAVLLGVLVGLVCGPLAAGETNDAARAEADLVDLKIAAEVATRQLREYIEREAIPEANRLAIATRKGNPTTIRGDGDLRRQYLDLKADLARLRQIRDCLRDKRVLIVPHDCDGRWGGGNSVGSFVPRQTELRRWESPLPGEIPRVEFVSQERLVCRLKNGQRAVISGLRVEGIVTDAPLPLSAAMLVYRREETTEQVGLDQLLHFRPLAAAAQVWAAEQWDLTRWLNEKAARRRRPSAAPAAAR